MASDEMVIEMIKTWYVERRHYSADGAALVARRIRDHSPIQWEAWQAVAEKAIEVGL